MKKGLKSIFNICIVVGLFCIMVVSFSIYGYGASIHGDEYFSIGFANNTEDFLFLSQSTIDKYGTDGWLDGEFLHDWLSVQPEEQFSFMQIHRNVRNDVHPPLYFMLLNFMSSFFVDRVTLIPGYIINVCAGVVICILLYLISRRIFTNKWLALVPSLFWAASNAACISITYIRMYGTLCALCLICLYFHLEFLEKEKLPKYVYIVLGICTTIGTLTHYYFYIWLFVLFWVTVVVCIHRKRIKQLLFYGLSLALGEMVSIAAYPYVFRHLLFSERGTQAQQNLTNIDFNYYKEFFKKFMDTINWYVYTNRFQTMAISFLFLVCLAAICSLIRRKKGMKNEEVKTTIRKNGYFNLAIIAILALGYFLILFKISYSSRWMYISPVFALLVILTVAAFAMVLQKISPRYYAYILFGFCALCMMKLNLTNMKNGIAAHSQIERNHEKVVQYAANCDVLFFYTEWNNLYDNQILELMDFHQIRAIPVEEMETADYQSILETRKEKNNLMIYIPTEVFEYQEKVNALEEKLDAVHVSKILEDKHAIYYVEMN